MAVDSNFSSLLQNLKLDDPWLPSKPWECISSESGVHHRSHNQDSKSSLQQPIYDPSSISEINLVRLAINALQGVETSIHSIEKLSELFSTVPADRTFHRIPNLWHRSSSTNAMGKALKTLGRTGFVTFLIRKFVDYFRCQNFNVGETSTTHHTCSLANQAFVVAVEKLLEGVVCALDTLYASVQLRRSPENIHTSVNKSTGVGCLTSVVHSEITFMEVYLHTKELRTQIETIGNICLFKNVAGVFSMLSISDLTSEAMLGFRNFPKGGDLLTYLYAQLRDADPVHHALLKFLFIRTFEPYYGFIKSWIYEARINDPYKEFIIGYVDGSPSYSHDGISFSDSIWLPSIRIQDEVSVPCFLENFCLPLLRAGQQLQVLIKLLELCNCVRAGDQAYKDILPCWSDTPSFCSSTRSPLTFSKTKMEEIVLMRENMYKILQEKLRIVIARLDNRYQPISTVMPFGLGDIQVSCSTDEVVINPTVFKGQLDLEASTPNSETSGAEDDISYQVEPFESSSECSSWNSFEEKNETEEPIVPNDSLIEAELGRLSALAFLRDISNGNRSLNLSQSEKPSALEHVCPRTMKAMDPRGRCSDPCVEKKSNCTSEHYNSAFSGTLYADHQSVNCWPLGWMSRNPFYDEGGRKDESQSLLTDFALKVPDMSKEVLFRRIPFSEEPLTYCESLPQKGRRDIQLESGTLTSSGSHISTPWKLNYNCDVFTMNPMLTQNAWGCMIDKSDGRNCLDHKQISLSYFDFSSVEDPCMVYGKELIAVPDLGLQSKQHLSSDSAVSSSKDIDKCSREQKSGEPDITVGHINSLSGTQFENRQEENSLTRASGGSKWESSLNYLGKGFKHRSGGHDLSSGSTFSIPLDVIVEKCILQEILLQYGYISNFTIKLLEEGFDLQEHLLALRRYHFMEFADWADLFIMSLWRHKWSVAESREKISEIQGFLELAVQRSSCEGDPHKERLYLYMKDHGNIPLSSPANGVHAFDFIALGYRVDWPISIVLTPNALKIYADIFSFLIQVKLAVFSLTDVWCTMKDLALLISQNQHPELEDQDKTNINILMRMRHQINHFVSTLQQYIQSELSHVSWCKFLHSLKHQVKDMFDLELVHMAYLADSLHVCFLSDETRPIAGIIDAILQCALDFRSCFMAGSWDVGSSCRESSKFLGRLNFSQVLNIKAIFDKNLKELYLCYLKSPKHGEFSLCRFWGYLNYNDYYSNVIGNGAISYTL